MSLLLGIDVGTSSTKALLIDERARVVASAATPHDISRPHPGWSEQDPEWWWQSTCAAVRAALASAGSDPGSIAGVGLSGQMHGSVFLDRAAVSSRGCNAPAIRPALLWNDQRTAAQCAAIEAAAGGRAKLVEQVGNAALPGFTLPKILWLREHEPDHFARVAMILLPKDYIRFRFTGLLATDIGDASGTLLTDIDRRCWSVGALARAGISENILPRIHESAVITGEVTTWAASQLGLNAGTPVVAGSGDNQCGAIGAGVVESGIALATLGTSGVVYAHADSPRRDLHPARPPGRLHTMGAADGNGIAPGHWSLTGCMLSAAGALHWARDLLAPDSSFDEVISLAAQSSPGCEGLVFLPYLTGERCPYPDPHARAGWIGLTSRHTRAHMLRAVIEGVTFGMAQIVGLVCQTGVRVDRIRLGGGGARSEFWRQLQADVYGLPVDLPNTEEGPALGAALLAGVGAGLWPDVRAACRATIRITESREPDSEMTERLAPARAAYERLYGDLSPVFTLLS